MKSERRTFKTRSTKYSSSQGAANAKCPLKMTRSKQESTATIKLVNLVMKRDSVFMAFSSGRGLCKPHSGGRTPFFAHPIWLRLCRVGLRRRYWLNRSGKCALPHAALGTDFSDIGDHIPARLI